MSHFLGKSRFVSYFGCEMVFDSGVQGSGFFGTCGHRRLEGCDYKLLWPWSKAHLLSSWMFNLSHWRGWTIVAKKRFGTFSGPVHSVGISCRTFSIPAARAPPWHEPSAGQASFPQHQLQRMCSVCFKSSSLRWFPAQKPPLPRETGYTPIVWWLVAVYPRPSWITSRFTSRRLPKELHRLQNPRG